MQAEKAYSLSKSTVNACVPGSVFAAHSFWVERCVEVSAVWKEQGAVFGTIHLSKKAARDIYVAAKDTGEPQGCHLCGVRILCNMILMDRVCFRGRKFLCGEASSQCEGERLCLQYIGSA